MHVCVLKTLYPEHQPRPTAAARVFLGSDAPAGGQSFTCTHNGATGFALAYSGTGRLISLVTEGVQPPPANSTPSSAPSSPTGMTAVVR